jgi:hypothetical protein
MFSFPWMAEGVSLQHLDFKSFLLEELGPLLGLEGGSPK